MPDRHPRISETEIIRLKQANARLREQLEAVTTLGLLVPPDYATAIAFAAFVAFDRPVTDEPRRGNAASRPPPRNPAAYSVLRREQSFLTNRSRAVRSSVERAVERPEDAWQLRRHP